MHSIKPESAIGQMVFDITEYYFKHCYAKWLHCELFIPSQVYMYKYMC